MTASMNDRDDGDEIRKNAINHQIGKFAGKPHARLAIDDRKDFRLPGD